MITETEAKFQRELNSFKGLVILNIVFGALAMALAIAIVVQSILALIQTQSLLLPEIALVPLGFVVAAISIRWLVSSAELLEGVEDMKEDYQRNKNTLDEEGITAQIVKMMAHYRENKLTIKTMMLISRIAGGCFLISGGFSLATAVINAMAGAPIGDVLIQLLGTGFSFAMATASLTIPHFFGKYSKIWDYRLKETAKAEIELSRQLEEA
jgi:hypothetical protein